MFELFADLFDTSDFPARWHCGNWSDVHGWVHVTADVATWGAYIAIPLVLAYFVRRRGDLLFPGVFWLFCAFIFSCGTMHLFEAIIFWWPAYRLLGLIKLFTALVSWATVLSLLPIVPRALRLPGLAKINAELEHEIEERTRAEESLRIEEEKYRTLVAAMSSIVWTAQPGGGFIASELWGAYTGQSVDEQTGDGWLDAVHPEDRERVQVLWQTSVREGTIFEASFRLWHVAHERHCHVEAKGVPLRHSDHGIREWIGTVTDVDDRVRATEELNAYFLELERLNTELQRSNRELDDFAYIASHDLKEPLRGIHNFASFVLEDCRRGLDEDSRHKLETIVRLSKRMTQQLESLLHYSRVGRLDLAIAEVDLGDVVAEVLDSLQATIGENEVEIRIPEPLPPVVCDRARIGELFHNLISNAIKYNDKPEKWLEIGWKEREDGATICYVSDNGIGIAPRQIDSIFRIFRRLHGRDEYGSGTGAGLTIVKKIVERHGGRIWVDSRPGEGTTFYFVLQESARSTRREGDVPPVIKI